MEVFSKMKKVNNINSVFQGIGSFTGMILDATEKLGDKVSNGISVVTEWVNTFEKQVGYLGHLLPDFEIDSTMLNKHENVLAVMLVQEAFIDEDVELIDMYIENDLKLKPNHDIRQALWQITIQSKRWMQIEAESLTNYLYVSVRNEASRIKRDREIFDSQWERSEKIVYSDPEAMEFECTRILSPEAAVIRAEERRIRFKIIQELKNNGSIREKRILEMFLAGYTPVECVKGTGGKWSHYQAVQRKLGRRFKKIFYQECLVT